MNCEKLAPVVLFAFNRSDHLRQTLEALAANKLADKTRLIIYCDGPRTAAEQNRTDAVRAVASAARGFRSLEVRTRESNWGLSKNIISGITEIVDRYGKVIVLEDDLITSPHFLAYMNDGLEVYADSPHVGAIHAWFLSHTLGNLPETFFLLSTGCWGWGTWKRAWDDFNADGQMLKNAIEQAGLTFQFNLDGSYPYMHMLTSQIEGKNDSWAVRWYASNFLHGRYTLNPARSLVTHIGMDASGTHCRINPLFQTELSQTPIHIRPQKVSEDAVIGSIFRDFCIQITRPAI